MKTFTMNNKKYETDNETFKVLQDVVKGYKATGDATAVIAVMELGLHTGRIKEDVSLWDTIENLKKEGHISY